MSVWGLSSWGWTWRERHGGCQGASVPGQLVGGTAPKPSSEVTPRYSLSPWSWGEASLPGKCSSHIAEEDVGWEKLLEASLDNACPAGSLWCFDLEDLFFPMTLAFGRAHVVVPWAIPHSGSVQLFSESVGYSGHMSPVCLVNWKSGLKAGADAE